MSVYSTTAPRSGRTRFFAGFCLFLVAAGVAATGLALGNRSGTGRSSAQVKTAKVVRPTSLMQLTPGEIAGGALGGYAIPDKGPTLRQTLASMSPQTRQYTERVMSLTFRQLAAGGAGHP